MQRNNGKDFAYVFTCGHSVHCSSVKLKGDRPICEKCGTYTKYRLMECAGVDGYRQCSKIIRVDPNHPTVTRCPECQDLLEYIRNRKEVSDMEADIYYGCDEVEEKEYMKIVFDRIRKFEVPKIKYTPVLWRLMREKIKIEKNGV